MSKKRKIENKIDFEFKNLIGFIKERDYEQLFTDIKHNFEYHYKHEKLNFLNVARFYNEHKLWGEIDLDKGKYEVIENNTKSLLNDRKNYEWLYYNLGDYKSKKILVTILKYWLMLEFFKIDKIKDETYDQYFDLDLIKCNKDEVFIDIGGYIGDTLINYSINFGSENYKKMYCYEIVPKNIEYIKKNVESFNLKNIDVRQKGVADKSGVLYFQNDEVSSVNKLAKSGNIKTDVVTIDDDIDEKVTFIKMDIEGFEEKALLGCKNKIIENHPKLALSAYHNNKHLWKLAKIINSFDPTYKFYLRYYGGRMIPTEYILYAL